MFYFHIRLHFNGSEKYFYNKLTLKVSTNIANSGNTQTAGGMAMSGKQINFIRSIKSLSNPIQSPSSQFSFIRIQNKPPDLTQSAREKTVSIAIEDQKAKNRKIARDALAKLYYKEYNSKGKKSNKAIENYNMSAFVNTTQYETSLRQHLKIKALEELSRLYGEKQRLSKRSLRSARDIIQNAPVTQKAESVDANSGSTSRGNPYFSKDRYKKETGHYLNTPRKHPIDYNFVCQNTTDSVR